MWELTATAEVTITDASALQAAARSNEGFVITVPAADLSVKEAGPEEPGAAPGDDVFDALAWLIWPSDGLEGMLDAGALRLLSVESQAKGNSIDQATATWSVTVKLTDVEALRRFGRSGLPGRGSADLGQPAGSLATSIRPVRAAALDRRNHLETGASHRRAPPCQGWPKPLKPRRAGLPLRGRNPPDLLAAV